MIFVIAGVIIVLTFALGGLLAWAVKGFDKSVEKTQEAITKEERAYNPALTLGFAINSQAPTQEQLREARLIAARQAAALPRGANMRIGFRDDPGGLSASVGVKEDPLTAARIAQFHGWDGARTGIPAGGVAERAAAPVAAATAAPAAESEIELVPGKDYPVIEITDDMPADEVRKARIANAKAKSAAMKKAKAAGVGAAAAATAAPSQARPGAAVAAPSPAAMGIAPPQFTPITDDMSPDEVRKARITNSKARSAFNKALKAAGIDPQTVEIDDEGNVVMPEAVTAPAAGAEAPPIPAPAPGAGAVDLASLGVQPPQLVRITEDMSPDEVRTARIANSKARSAFNKALKAAGMDPQTVEIDDEGNVVLPEGPAAQTPAAAPAVAVQAASPAAQPAGGDGDIDLAALGITPPDLVPITDDMSPDEVRQARISNSKARSAFNKALKAAGVDPKNVEL